MENNLSPLDISELCKAITAILNYHKTGNRQELATAQEEIKHCKAIDFSIKTHNELDTNSTIKAEHNPNRMLVFLLNYYGEHYVDGGYLTIYNDDPDNAKAAHTNTYRLVLKDKVTHDKIFPGNPTPKDEPYDFKTEFIKQITVYSDNMTNTTDHAYDSFKYCYTTPTRKLDFKSALWKKNNEHNVHYIIKIDDDGKMSVQDLNRNIKQFDFSPNSLNSYYLKKYLEILKVVRNQTLAYYDWDAFILN